MIRVLAFLLVSISTWTLATDDVEIGALLLNDTKSRSGRDFFYQFSQYWHDIPDKGGINVQITEQVVPRAGTKLMVLMNRQLIYVTHMGRRQSPVKEKVEQALYRLINAMAQSKINLDNPDMAKNGW